MSAADRMHFPTSQHEHAAADIVAFFVEQPDTQAVLLTNSCARGKGTRDSCLDMQVLTGTERIRNVDHAWRRYARDSSAIANPPTHVEHLTMFTAESFGGPDRFTRELGFAHLIDVHRGLHINEAQRQRFVELYLAALDKAEMPSDPAFREAVREHIEFGSHVAMQNSNAETDEQLHPLRDVPHWKWPGEQDKDDNLADQGEAES